MKIMISGGGTGGHIYPALSIAEEIKKIVPDAQIIYVGTEAGLEREIVPRYGYEMRYIEVAGFKRSFGWDTFRSIYLLYKGLQQAGELINKEQPDLVIGTGGYVCGPVVYKAARAGIPTCIQEQNALPGVTNKILARMVDRVLLGYEQATKYFKAKGKMIFTGNPIRNEILQQTRMDSYKELGLNPQLKTILVFGGSRGARSINAAMAEVELELCQRSDVQVLHATGDANYAEHLKALENAGGLTGENIHIVPYLHNMPVALAVADLVVCRAGAIGLAEVMAKGIPGILIPFPFATGNHQEYNARALESKGAARVILDKELSGKILLQQIQELLDNPDLLQDMHVAALKEAKPKAGQDIADIVMACLFDSYKKFHFVGIGGAGMSAIASVLLSRGYKVQGSDLNGGEVVSRLVGQGAKIKIGHAAENIEGADCLVLSSAIHSDNPEVVAAKKQGIPIFHRSHILSWLVNDKDGVTVAGAHGKTTTTSMLAYIAHKAGIGATALIGGDVAQLGGNAVVGEGNYVIAEADESDGSFLKFKPQIAVVTNIEDDHLDHYGTEENIYLAFRSFINNVKDGGCAVLCGDNPKVRRMIGELEGTLPIVTYGLNDGEYTGVDVKFEGMGSSYTLLHDGNEIARVELSVPGIHNVQNSLGAFATAVNMGISKEVILEALKEFGGAKRRFETKAKVDGIWFVDDYAHHPTEIKAVLKAAKDTGSKRIVVCFQPHRYTRTKLLMQEFLHAFDDCDILIVTDVYAASENPIAGGTSDVLVNNIKAATGKDVVYTPTYEDAFNHLKGIIQPGDLVMSIGAGRADLVIERLARERNVR